MSNEQKEEALYALTDEIEKMKFEFEKFQSDKKELMTKKKERHI